MKNLDKKRIKIVITDLDNTYLGNGFISDFGKSIIQKLIDENYYVVFATGRNKELANNAFYNENIYYAVMNGAAIYKGNCLIEKSGYFEKEQLNFLSKYFKQYNVCVNFISDYSTICNLNKKQYMETIFKRNVSISGEKAASTIIPTKFINDVNTIDENIYKIEVNFNNHNSYLRAYKELSNMKEINIYGSNRDYIEINNADADKAFACLKLCSMLNINSNEVIVFGDSKNDLKNLKSFPYSVCVANASEEIKSVCYDICDTGKNDGVAHYLNNLFF